MEVVEGEANAGIGDACLDAVLVHVLDPLVGNVAALSDVFELPGEPNLLGVFKPQPRLSAGPEAHELLFSADPPVLLRLAHDVRRPVEIGFVGASSPEVDGLEHVIVG